MHYSFYRGFFRRGISSDFFLFMYVIQHCFICRPSDSTASEDAGIVPRTFAALAFTLDALTTRLDLIIEDQLVRPIFV